jgi:hypothetical protein
MTDVKKESGWLSRGRFLEGMDSEATLAIFLDRQALEPRVDDLLISKREEGPGSAGMLGGALRG